MTVSCGVRWDRTRSMSSHSGFHGGAFSGSLFNTASRSDVLIIISVASVCFVISGDVCNNIFRNSDRFKSWILSFGGSLSGISASTVVSSVIAIFSNNFFDGFFFPSSIIPR